MAAKTSGEEQKLTFEQAMERLESIVQEMESDQLPLEKLLNRYEEGVQLVSQCNERLTAAVKRIQKIAQDAAGKLKLEPFEESSTEE